jgi:hypothetical protein
MSSSRFPASIGALFGLIAVLAIPAAAVLAAFTSRATLLHAVYVAVPVAAAASLVAVAACRRARARLERSVRRSGAGIVRASRILAFAGLYLAVTGALALGFYGLLRLRS